MCIYAWIHCIESFYKILNTSSIAANKRWSQNKYQNKYQPFNDLTCMNHFTSCIGYKNISTSATPEKEEKINYVYLVITIPLK
jgi:hypothetical protein